MKLLDHEARNRAERDLGGRRFVYGKELLELLLTKVVGEISNHDLDLGRDPVLGRATLLALARSTRLLVFCRHSVLVGLIRSLGERNHLPRAGAFRTITLWLPC